MAILTINKKVFAEEFSLEIGNIPSENAQIKSAAMEFIRNNYPNLQINVVRIMVGKVPFVTFHIKTS